MISVGGITAGMEKLRLYSRLLNKYFADQLTFPTALSQTPSQSRSMSLFPSASSSTSNHEEMKITDSTYSSRKYYENHENIENHENHENNEGDDDINKRVQGDIISQLECSMDEEHSAAPVMKRSLTLIPGTIRLSKENGTSGIFIAKFRKKAKVLSFKI